MRKRIRIAPSHPETTALRFADRRDAGRRLAEIIRKVPLDDPLILALPRGGVPVAFEVAKALQAPLDLLMVRKIGAPGQAEYALGAIVDGADPQLVLNQSAMEAYRLPPGYLDAESKRQLAELERRRVLYLGGRPAADSSGRTVVVVDDGVATGSTVTAALRALRGSRAAKTVLAVPVAPANLVKTLQNEADDLICLSAPRQFRVVGAFYLNFDQVADQEVIDLLKAASSWARRR